MSRVEDLESLLKTILSVTETPLLVAAEDGPVIATSAAFGSIFGWTSTVADLPGLDRLITSDAAAASDDLSRPVLVLCGNGRKVPATERSALTSMGGRRWRIVGLTPEPSREDQTLTAARLLSGMKEGRSTVLTGRLQLVGLEEVRSRLGDDWKRWSERAFAVAESVLRDRIHREDVFARSKSGDFIVCFSTLDGEAAWYKAQAIAREIREKLIGESAEGELADVKVETHAVAVSESDLTEQADIPALLSRKIDEKSAHLQEERARLLNEVYEQAVLAPQRVYTTDGGAVPAMTAVLDAESSLRLDALKSAAGGAGLQGEIDLLVLDRSVDHVVASLDHGDNRVLIIPLHYSTLNFQKTRATYIGLCRKLPDAVRRMIGFSIREIPEHVHPGRAGELVGQLRDFARLRMLHLTRPDLQGIELRDAGISAIALTYLALAGGLRNRPQAVRAFVKGIQLQRARFVVTFVPDKAGARKAAEHGATMVTFDPARMRL